MTVHLIHGIRTGPDSPVKGLIPYLQTAGYDVRYVDYGWEWETETKIVNPMIAGSIQPYIEEGDICIGHSNGCAIIYDLMTRGAPMKAAVFINGALERNFAVPASTAWVDVYWNSGDTVTELAQLGADIGIFASDWGELGHAGYDGVDLRVSDIDCGTTKSMPVISGHSDFFSPDKLLIWQSFLIGRLGR